MLPVNTFTFYIYKKNPRYFPSLLGPIETRNWKRTWVFKIDGFPGVTTMYGKWPRLTLRNSIWVGLELLIKNMAVLKVGL